MFAKLDLAALQSSLILRRFFTLYKHKFARVLRNCRLQIESNDIQKERAANSILITRPKNKQVLNVLDTMQRPLQCGGADMDTFFRLEKQLPEIMQNNIKQTTMRSILRDWNNVVYD